MLTRCLRDNLPNDLPLAPAGQALEDLSVYIEMLRAWNRAINLAGFDDPIRIFTELVTDSFHLAYFIERLFPNFNGIAWDAGAGAGLPGIPLRIVWQKGFYTLIEARQKRALFMANVLARLNLPATKVLETRFEKFLASAKANADLLISRAFMPWQKLLTLYAGRVNDCVIIMSSQKPESGMRGLLDYYAYQAAGKNRYLWAIAPHA